MKKGKEEASPETRLRVSVVVSSMNADDEGCDEEIQRLRKKLLKEEFGDRVSRCLLDMDDVEFDRLVYLLTELKAHIAIEQAKTPDAEVSAPNDTIDSPVISSKEMMDKVLESRQEHSSYEDFEKHVKASWKQIREVIKREAAEKTGKYIAWKMQCLGYPLHTILRVTGFMPQAEDTTGKK